MKEQKIIFIPPTYLFISIIIVFLCYRYFLAYNLIKYPYDLIISLPIIILASYLIISSHLFLVKNNTTEKYSKSTCVVQDWLYKYSRNPMYLWFLLLIIWISFFLDNLISFISPIFFFYIINWMFMPYEEAKMEKELGQDYLEYKGKVRRWV